MAGFQSKKIFCESKRKDGQNCLAKGFPTKKGRYLCRFHGGQNTNFFGFRDRAGRGGFNKPNYTDNTRLLQLKGLRQFKNYSHEQLKEYYENKVKPTLEARRNKLPAGRSVYGIYASRIVRQGKVKISDQLTTVLQAMQKQPRTRKRGNGS